jgi:hypothetical protein
MPWQAGEANVSTFPEVGLASWSFMLRLSYNTRQDGGVETGIESGG